MILRVERPIGDESGMYSSFAALKEREIEGLDYIISHRARRSPIAVMAPHGGDIEPGTSEIASALAGDRHTFYAFEGMKPRGNGALHIASTHFDEPMAMKLAAGSAFVVTIHGCRGKEEMVCMGGLNLDLMAECRRALVDAGFLVAARDGMRGMRKRNLCNLGRGAAGVQLELTTGLRGSMFENLTREGRRSPRPALERFVSVLRRVFDQCVWNQTGEGMSYGRC
jgi:phage replication-related protein YjqB (UPF0714/DUF867 family)